MKPQWLIFAPVALLAVFSSGVQAQSNYGINAVYYVIPDVPPIKTDNAYQSCGSEIENNINRNFEGEPFEGCPTDLLMVHYTGFITLPAHQTIRFWIAADDGGTMKIGTTEWGDWNDKGCSAIETDALTLDAGVPLVLDGWFYENGGGTCYMLAWQIDNGDWEIVPDEAFTRTTPETTTSTSTTTSTTSTTSTTTTSTSTTSTTVQPSTTIASTIAPTSTVQATTSTSTTGVPSTSSTTTSTQPLVLEPTTTTTTSLPEVIIPEEVSPLVAELLANIDELPQSEIASVVAETIDAGLSNEDAVALATSAEVLSAVTGEIATEIFEALDVETLTDQQAEQLVEAVQSASEEVRQAFEQTIDLFNGKTDTYVPLGSAVPVRTRRAVIAVTGLLAIAAVPSPISGQSKQK